nr:unnamed protein product [Spirometra erinaceieuropaei]
MVELYASADPPATYKLPYHPVAAISYDPVRQVLLEQKDLQEREERHLRQREKARRHQSGTTLGAVCKRLAYFFTFYTILVLLFFGYLNWYMYFQVSRDYPKLTGWQSALQMNPGLSQVPNPNIFNSLLRFRTREPLPYSKYQDEIVAFLHAYQDNTGCMEMEDCVQEGGFNQDVERPCAYDLNAGGPCNIMNGYGFDTAQPCFALKMGKIYGWLPEPVDFATGVLVKCEGATEDDTNNLGIIRYFDMDYKFSAIAPGKNPGKVTNGSFHSMFFPYRNQYCYHQPLVFVQFDGVRRNKLIRVQCYLIAKNINVDIARLEGSTRFEILID